MTSQSDKDHLALGAFISADARTNISSDMRIVTTRSNSPSESLTTPESTPDTVKRRSIFHGDIQSALFLLLLRSLGNKWAYNTSPALIRWFERRWASNVIWTLPVTGNVVALTIDDAPCSHTGLILDELKRNGAHATFFVIGNQIERNPECITRMFNEGHQVCPLNTTA